MDDWDSIMNVNWEASIDQNMSNCAQTIWFKSNDDQITMTTDNFDSGHVLVPLEWGLRPDQCVYKEFRPNVEGAAKRVIPILADGQWRTATLSVDWAGYISLIFNQGVVARKTLSIPSTSMSWTRKKNHTYSHPFLV